jgi:hypothetical protein
MKVIQYIVKQCIARISETGTHAMPGTLQTRDYSALIITRMGQFLSFDQVLYGSQDCPMIWMNGA